MSIIPNHSYDTYPTKTDERHLLQERIHRLLSLRDEKAHELRGLAIGLGDLAISMQRDVFLSDSEETEETIKRAASTLSDFWLALGRLNDCWREALDDMEALSETPSKPGDSR
jgi:hypothetical protein